MAKEIELLDRYEQINAVAQMYIKGTTNPTTIAKELGIKRAEALDLIAEWRDIAKSNDDIREQASEALQAGIQHYSMIVERFWETVEQADTNQDYKTKNAVLKNIADVEAKKIDMLQKAGLYDDASIGDELAEMEEKQAILVSILKEVTSNCDHCKIEVARRLSKVTGKAEPVTIPGEVTE
jgi:bacterioferritin (cytochrome b1)